MTGERRLDVIFLRSDYLFCIWSARNCDRIARQNSSRNPGSERSNQNDNPAGDSDCELGRLLIFAASKALDSPDKHTAASLIMQNTHSRAGFFPIGCDPRQEETRLQARPPLTRLRAELDDLIQESRRVASCNGPPLEGLFAYARARERSTKRGINQRSLVVSFRFGSGAIVSSSHLELDLECEPARNDLMLLNNGISLSTGRTERRTVGQALARANCAKGDFRCRRVEDKSHESRSELLERIASSFARPNFSQISIVIQIRIIFTQWSCESVGAKLLPLRKRVSPNGSGMLFA